MADDETTLGELVRTLVRIEATLSALRTDVSATYVRKDVQRERDRQSDERITAVEDRQRWIARALVGSLLFPTLVLIVAYVVVGARPGP